MHELTRVPSALLDGHWCPQLAQHKEAQSEGMPDPEASDLSSSREERPRHPPHRAATRMKTGSHMKHIPKCSGRLPAVSKCKG